MLNPPTDTLSAEEAEAVVKILRSSTDLGEANRTLCREYPQWGLPQRLAALRQAQNAIFRDWQKSPARKRREALARGHAGVSASDTEEQP